MCRVEHSHVPELRGQEGARAVDELGAASLLLQGLWGLCIEALAKAGIGAANTLKSLALSILVG